MFAKRKSKHPYDTLREKAKLIKKWKEKVEEGSDRRKRHRNVRKPVVSKHVETSTSNSYGTSSGHIRIVVVNIARSIMIGIATA